MRPYWEQSLCRGGQDGSSLVRVALSLEETENKRHRPGGEAPCRWGQTGHCGHLPAPVATSPVRSPHSLQGRGSTRSPYSPNPGLHLGLLWLEPCSPDSHGRLFSAHTCWLSSGTSDHWVHLDPSPWHFLLISPGPALSSFVLNVIMKWTYI